MRPPGHRFCRPFIDVDTRRGRCSSCDTTGRNADGCLNPWCNGHSVRAEWPKMAIVWYGRELVNKAELIDALAVRLGEKKTATAALDAVLAEVQATVTKGDKVSITGFGVFEKRVRAARMARNPRTGEAVKVKKTAIPAFRAGAGFKDMVASGRAPSAARKSAAKSTARSAAKSAARTTRATAAKATKATTAKATTAR